MLVHNENLDLQHSIGEILITQLEKGNPIRTHFRGSSMSPFLQDSDVITIHPIAFEEIKVGDIIAYKGNADDRVLTLHRVVKRIKGAVVTKGDGNRHGDFPVYPKQIFGKICRIERKGKTRDLDAPVKRLAARYLAFRSLYGSRIRELFTDTRKLR